VTIRDIKPVIHDDGTKGVWMRNSRYQLEIFTPAEARNVAAQLAAAADELDGR
jgi:hypothetical protein